MKLNKTETYLLNSVNPYHNTFGTDAARSLVKKGLAEMKSKHSSHHYNNGNCVKIYSTVYLLTEAGIKFVTDNLKEVIK